MLDYKKLREENIRKMMNVESAEDNLKDLLEEAYDEGFSDALAVLLNSNKQ